jgi:RNA polymerase sigma-70 factor (ECF subfamily)
LYRIAANEALMMIRRRKSNFNLEDMQPEDADDISLPETFVDWSLLPEKELLSGEGKTVLEKAIKQLPENLRMVFILRDVEDLSIKETAEILNLTEVNVKTRLLRARMALREQLSSYYAERAARKET